MARGEYYGGGGGYGTVNPFATNYPDLGDIDEQISKIQHNRLLSEDMRSQIEDRAAERAFRQQPLDLGGTAGGAAPATPAGTFEQKMGASEGGANPAAVNAGGYSGQFQFGAARLADLGLYKPAEGEDLKKNEWKGTFSIPGFSATTHDEFLKSPAAQHAAFGQHVADIDKVIAGTPGADKLDQNGLRAVAHLGGNAGMQRFISSGGLYDPADANGTRLSDYYKKFAAGGAPALQAAFGSPHGPGGPQQADAAAPAPGGVAARTGGVDVAGPGVPPPVETQQPGAPAPAAAAPAPAAPIPTPAAPAPAAEAVPPPTRPPPRNALGLTDNDQVLLQRMHRDPKMTSAGLAQMQAGMKAHGDALDAQYRNELQQDAATRGAAAERDYQHTHQATSDAALAEERRLAAEDRRKAGERADAAAARADAAAARAGLSAGYEPDPNKPGAQRYTEGGPADPKVRAAEAKARGEGGRVLPHADRAKLISGATQLDQLTEASTGFNDKYGGFYSSQIGDLYNVVARNTPGGSDRAEWWQNYQRMKLAVRQGISGQSLTATEKAEFDKADINPGMSPAAIRANLATQRKLFGGAQRRLVRTLAADGYNPRALEEASGISPEDEAPAPAANGSTRPPLSSFQR